MTFNKNSYSSHEAWFEKQYTDSEKKSAAIDHWLVQKKHNTLNMFIQNRLMELAKPLFAPNNKWLTVGDGYGFDANYLYDHKQDVIASDISNTFLELSKQKGLFEKYAIENAENLSFPDDSIDYILVKEAYHHFPRPYLAVYEMLRVAQKGLILIEPHDPISRMPLLLFLKNVLDRVNVNLLSKFWKNRYSYEAVGNFVFKLSEREIEKIALGLNLPCIAFKGINNNYWKPYFNNTPLESPKFRSLKVKIMLHNLLCKLSFMPYQVLSAIIFKQIPDTHTIEKLKAEGYTIYMLPKNPYI
jgi:ubiquinone/menaquinone biosynthesis C-methylase UbiE